MAASKPLRRTQVLSLGLPRTGTSSMCEALTLLGYKDVYHGIKSIDSPTDWAVFSRAADATFPNLPTYTGKPFTVAEWDEVFGECEGITDIGSLFGPQLIQAYPDAKVILVKRDFDRWYKSINEQVFQALWGRLADFFVETVEPIIGSVAGPANRKMLLGFFRASTVDEVRQHARETYDRHYRTIKEMTPPENLLELDLKDGWRPLCEFLGKDVPAAWAGREDEFPSINEAAAMRKKIIEQQIKLLKRAVVVVAPYLSVVALAGVAWYIQSHLL